MNEALISELVNYVVNTRDRGAIQARLSEYHQAVEWAEQQQRWDVVIDFADALSNHFEKVEEQSKEQTSEIMRDFWKQGQVFVRQGLLAAKQIKNQEKELKFLVSLSRLSGYLGGFEMAVDYIKQELCLVRPDMKWRTARAVRLLGNQANNLGDFSAARVCYQTSLDVFQELGYKSAMAEVLAFMAANELARIERGFETGQQFSDDLRFVIELLWELGHTLRHEAELEQAKLTDEPAVSVIDAGGEATFASTYQRVQEALAKLNSLT